LAALQAHSIVAASHLPQLLVQRGELEALDRLFTEGGKVPRNVSL
jgi:hypothetical protein